jgi:hypothetical protein
MADHTVEEKVLLILAAIVGLFLIFSLTAGLILAAKGVDTTGVWDQAFNLVNVLAGALVGYVSGTYINKTQIPPEHRPNVQFGEEEGHR